MYHGGRGGASLGMKRGPTHAGVYSAGFAFAPLFIAALRTAGLGSARFRAPSIGRPARLREEARKLLRP
jgi:hypothetical protein